MRLQLLFFLTLSTIQSYGQCGSGRAYRSGFYHNTNFVNPEGDTLNRLDGSGLFHGLHVYTDNRNNIYSDTNTFSIGKFEHGIPVGEWKDHCEDGSYSVGQFSVGSGETKPDGKGGWTSNKQGAYEKVGVWKYYDVDSNLIETEKYERRTSKNGWVHKTYRVDSAGNSIATMYACNLRYHSAFRKVVLREYTGSGIRISSEYENFWRDISKDYYENGKVKDKFKCVKIFGKKRNRSISKSYSPDGKLLEKRKGTCWKGIPRPSLMINDI